MKITKDNLRELSLSPEHLMVFGSLIDRIERLEAESKPKRNTFTPPEMNEVAEYMGERGSYNAFNEAEKFVDFYTSKGWFVGKTKMKDWKASVRQWLKRQQTSQAHLPMNAPPTQKQAVRKALRNINGTDW